VAHPEPPAPRYRVEEGRPWADVYVERVAQIFDKRDPAPFRTRDLDPDLVDYLRDAGEDLARGPVPGVSVHVGEACVPAEIEGALRAHFEYMVERLARARRQQRRTGQTTLAIALVMALALVAIASLVGRAVSGPFGVALEQGIVILAWVALWRPLEVLLYEGIPVRRERRVWERFLEGPIVVHAASTRGTPARAP
jgi:hypothetical protein